MRQGTSAFACAATVVALLCAPAAAWSSTPTASAAISVERTTVANGDVALPALLARPGTTARTPAPGIVLMHGCSGLWSKGNARVAQSHIRRWLRSLAAKGYFAIAPDSFGPRGVKTVCGRDPETTGVSEVTDRVRDAFAALAHLRGLRDVSDSRVAVLGWSNGGSAALAAVGQDAPVAPPAAGGFKAAVAFYPGCGLRGAFATYRPTVTTRVLAAARDPLLAQCRSRTREAGGHFHLTVYRGARHGFDQALRRGRDFGRADVTARRRADARALGTLVGALRPARSTSVFAPDSWTRAVLPDDAPLDPNQVPAIGLRTQALDFGTWVATTDWSSPVYVVPADQPPVKVDLDTRYVHYNDADKAALRKDLEAVPIPPGAFASGPPQTGDVYWSDKDLIVHQPATDTAWELYHATSWGSQWWATDGGKITNVSQNGGSYDRWPSGKPHGLTGSGIPLLSGLQRVEELQRGSIDHVVIVSIPHVKKAVFRWPALKTDGEWTTWDAVPEGARFRLPADLDIDALPLTPYAKMVARAIQRHGLLVIDRNCRPTDRKTCPSVTFKAESPRPVSPDPYEAIFGGVPRHRLFDNFPWDRLQLLAEE